MTRLSSKLTFHIGPSPTSLVVAFIRNSNRKRLKNRKRKLKCAQVLKRRVVYNNDNDATYRIKDVRELLKHNGACIKLENLFFVKKVIQQR